MVVVPFPFSNNFTTMKAPHGGVPQVVRSSIYNCRPLVWHGRVDFSSEIAISLNFTAEHTETAKAPESLNND